MLEYEYASSDVNIVMMMFFELFLLRKISEFPGSWEVIRKLVATRKQYYQRSFFLEFAVSS